MKNMPLEMNFCLSMTSTFRKSAKQKPASLQKRLNKLQKLVEKSQRLGTFQGLQTKTGLRLDLALDSFENVVGSWLTMSFN